MAKKTQPPPKTFEEALRELEAILTEIESGQLGLEESLIKYERGNFLIQHCRSVLNGAEKQIELLGRAPDGSLMVAPLPAGARPSIEAAEPEPVESIDAEPEPSRDDQ